MDDQLDGVVQVNEDVEESVAQAACGRAAGIDTDNEPLAEELRRAFEKGEYPYATKLSRRSYETQKAQL